MLLASPNGVARNAASSCTHRPQQQTVVAARATPVRRRRLAPCQAFPGAVESGMDVGTLSSVLVATIAVAGGAAILLSEPQPQQQSEQEPCPRCSGRGYEPCVCTRWSDADVGCGSCQRTGYMKCSACGGGGNARPLLRPIKMEVRNNRY